jgi:hypothetical protein
MLLSFLIIASGWWHIRAAYSSDSRQFYISKPLTMLFIIALAFGYQSGDHTAPTPGSCSVSACRWRGTCC